MDEQSHSSFILTTTTPTQDRRASLLLICEGLRREWLQAHGGGASINTWRREHVLRGGLSSFLFVLLFYKLRVNLESVPGYNSRVPLCGISLQEEECVFCGWCVAAIESLTTSPGVFHL